MQWKTFFPPLPRLLPAERRVSSHLYLPMRIVRPLRAGRTWRTTSSRRSGSRRLGPLEEGEEARPLPLEEEDGGEEAQVQWQEDQGGRGGS